MPQDEPNGEPKHGESAQSGSPLEPDVDPDSAAQLDEQITDPPHPPSRYDAGDGQGTASNPPWDSSLQERPILDGSTQSPLAEASVPNPYRGQSDPALVTRQPALNSTSTNRWLIASSIAAIVVTTVLLILAQWNPVWCGAGVVVALLGLLAMLVVRLSRLALKPRLRIEAILMTIIWLVPLVIIIWTMVAFADEIW